MSCLPYNDTVRLVNTTVNEYGSEVASDTAEVPAMVAQVTGYTHGANQTAVTSGTVVYVDPANSFVRTHFNRLEEMLVVLNLFGENETESWYKITGVEVGRDILLSNKIDNILLTLKKTTGISYAS